MLLYHSCNNIFRGCYILKLIKIYLKLTSQFFSDSVWLSVTVVTVYKKKEELKCVKQSAKLKPSQRVPSCCEKSSDVKFTNKPESHVEVD